MGERQLIKSKARLNHSSKEWAVVAVVSLYLVALICVGGETCDFTAVRCAAMGGTGVAVPDAANSGMNPATIYLGKGKSLLCGGYCGACFEAAYGVLYEPDSGLGAGSLTWQWGMAKGQRRWKQIAYNWATRIGEGLMLGASLKWEDCADYEDEKLSGNSVSLNIGGLLFGKDKVAVGFSGENVGRLYWSHDADDTAWSMGAAFYPAEDVLVAVDLVKSADWVVRLGSEYWMAPDFALRFGLAKGLAAPEAEIWTAGFGYRGQKMGINYAVRIDAENIVHGIELGINPF